MTVEGWDPDEAVLISASEEEDDENGEVDVAGPPWRYGVTGWESSHHEPLSVALAQEVPEQAVDDGSWPVGGDDVWLEVDDDKPFPGRLLADAQEGDDDLALAVVDSDEYAPEELAMHIEES